MFWESIGLVTIVDGIVIIVTIVGGSILFRAHQRRSGGHHVGSGAVIAGLGLVALFHLADLLIPHIAAPLVGTPEAMVLTENLRLHWRWPVMLIGFGLIAAGSVSWIRALLDANEGLSKSVDSLNMSDRRYREFAEAASDWLWETDEEHRFSYFSSEADKVDPNSRNRQLGMTRTDRRIPDDTDDAKWKAHAADLAAHRPFKDFEFPITVADGSVRHIRVSGWPVFSADGTFTGYRGTGTDLTERRRTEHALRESEAGLAKAQQLAQIGNWVRDYPTDTLEWSDEVFRIFGHAPRSFVPSKKDFLDAVHPDDRERDAAALQYAIKTHNPYTIDHRIIGPGGEVRWAHQEGEVEYDEAGRARRTFGTIQDITERKQAEDEVLRAKEEAEAANRAKSEFLSSMSHELRTPLNAVLGFGQLLADDADESQTPIQREAVSQIVAGGHHLLSLINELLDLARIESGNMSISLERLDAGTMLTETLNFASPVAKKQNVTLIQEHGSDSLPPVLADRKKLRQVLLNLITNAIKYNTADGLVTIACAATESGMMRFSIADTGRGIPQDMRARLFEPFDRLGVEASEIEGTGIGLTITKRLVEMMGGVIDFESVEGEGSTFWIDLPIADAGAKEADSPGESDAGSDDGVGETTDIGALDMPLTQQVLYIEDDVTNLRLMEAFIEQSTDVTLISAETAERGIALAIAERPDLILMDIGLPGMNGLDALAALRGRDLTRAIPVAAITADATPETAKSCHAAGFDAVLTKPIDLEEITNLLTEYRISNSTR